MPPGRVHLQLHGGADSDLLVVRVDGPQGGPAGYVQEGGDQERRPRVPLHGPADHQPALLSLHERPPRQRQHPRPLPAGGHGRDHQQGDTQGQGGGDRPWPGHLLGLLYRRSPQEPPRLPVLLPRERRLPRPLHTLPRPRQLHRDRLVPAVAGRRALQVGDPVSRRHRPRRRRYDERRATVHAVQLRQREPGRGDVPLQGGAGGVHDAQVVPVAAAALHALSRRDARVVGPRHRAPLGRFAEAAQHGVDGGGFGGGGHDRSGECRGKEGERRRDCGGRGEGKGDRRHRDVQGQRGGNQVWCHPGRGDEHRGVCPGRPRCRRAFSTEGHGRARHVDEEGPRGVQDNVSAAQGRRRRLCGGDDPPRRHRPEHRDVEGG